MWCPSCGIRIYLSIVYYSVLAIVFVFRRHSYCKFFRYFLARSWSVFPTQFQIFNTSHNHGIKKKIYAALLEKWKIGFFLAKWKRFYLFIQFVSSFFRRYMGDYILAELQCEKPSLHWKFHMHAGRRFYKYIKSIGVISQKLEGICRSTSAKPAVRRSPQQRTPQVHRAGVRNCKDISNTFTNYCTYDLIHLNLVLVNLYLG